jgi:hypothetical protein
MKGTRLAAMLLLTACAEVALCQATWDSDGAGINPPVTPSEGTYGPGTVTSTPGPPPAYVLTTGSGGVLTVPKEDLTALHVLAYEIALAQGDANNAVKFDQNGHVVGVRTR